MAGSIPVPLLLQSNIAKQLNNKMITTNKSFVFLGEPKKLINKLPSTYAEAFDQYVSGLYILYHDYGMFFLKSYTNETSNNSYFEHIKFIYTARAVLQHSEDYLNSANLYSKLKKYYFKGNNTFTYKDWNDFWLHASEIHWEILVKEIVKNSNSLYNNLLDKVASHDKNYRPLYESISNIFRTGKYTDKNGKIIEIYEKSFDYRFLKIVYNKLINSYVWADTAKAKQELTNLYKQTDLPSNVGDLKKNKKLTPQEIKNEAIAEMTKFLTSGDCSDSDYLFLSFCQNIKTLIDNQIKADTISLTEDLLD